jgi:hypothetical protein
METYTSSAFRIVLMAALVRVDVIGGKARHHVLEDSSLQLTLGGLCDIKCAVADGLSGFVVLVGGLACR